eukprot:360675-Chlamydomonas_euryale.AAC.16
MLRPPPPKKPPCCTCACVMYACCCSCCRSPSAMKRPPSIARPRPSANCSCGRRAGSAAGPAAARGMLPPPAAFMPAGLPKPVAPAAAAAATAAAAAVAPPGPAAPPPLAPRPRPRPPANCTPPLIVTPLVRLFLPPAFPGEGAATGPRPSRWPPALLRHVVVAGGGAG